MGDPLSLIRQSIIAGSRISLVDGYYTFGDQKVHESTPTAFKRTLKCKLLLVYPKLHLPIRFSSRCVSLYSSRYNILS